MSGTAQDLSLTLSYTLASQLQTRQSSNALYDWVPAVASKTYTPDALNRYASVAGTSFSYDGRGNLTSDATRTLTYDVENHLISVTGGAGVTLTYDPLGRLKDSTSAGVTTQFLYEGDRLVAEYNGATVLRRYAHGPGVDEPLVWYEGAGLTDRRWLHADERGSIIATSDGTGVATPYVYGPFGEPTAWTGVRFRYTGQIMIPEAQLYHYKARVYDPNLGRFLQTDPVGYKDDLDLYAYVGNDPLDGADPSGLTDYDCSKGVGHGNCRGSARVKDGDTIKVAGGTISVSQTGNIVYRETGGLRPTTKEGAGSERDLEGGQKAIAHVVQNRNDAGIKDGVAKDSVKLRFSLNRQFRAAQNAAAAAATEPDSTNGAKYYVLNQGQAMAEWVKHTHVTQSFGPFSNAAPGDTTTVGGSDINIQILEPDKGYH